MERLAPEDLVEDWSDLSTSSLAPGARLGRYQLLLPIAYGGMARVWAARLHGQRGFSKLVAIKTILPHLAHSVEFERMFLDEARIAAGVHHPNVTDIYELGEEGHVLYLAMEWVNGDSLVHLVRGLHTRAVDARVAAERSEAKRAGLEEAPHARKRAEPNANEAIGPRLAARIAADACAGLHAAHELTGNDGRPLHVVHRDVSPHNILVSLEGTVKVTDFGVAKAYGQLHQTTTAGQIKGKVSYIAPEILVGAPFDHRSDIFAMGCVLYEVTTGVQAFRGVNDVQIMHAVLRGAYAPAPAVVRGFPTDLAAIIDRAMAPEPRQRFPTAEAMRVALEEWLARAGPIVTPSQVGAAVRARLGPHLEKRREQVRAVMTAAELDPEWAGRARAAGGRLPSAPDLSADASTGRRSGIVPTQPDARRDPHMHLAEHPHFAPLSGERAEHPHLAPLSGERAEPAHLAPTSGERAEPAALASAAVSPSDESGAIRSPLPSFAPVSTSPMPAAMGPADDLLPGGRASAVPPSSTEVPAISAAATPATGAPYALAALAGLVFALLVGASVVVWITARDARPPAPVPPASADRMAPQRPAATAASHVAQPAPPRASAAPATIDINDLPVARPAWTSTPALRPAPPPATAKGPEIPANPY
jgi:serine/threonine-protein kinase